MTKYIVEVKFIVFFVSFFAGDPPLKEPRPPLTSTLRAWLIMNQNCKYYNVFLSMCYLLSCMIMLRLAAALLSMYTYIYIYIDIYIDIVLSCYSFIVVALFLLCILRALPLASMWGWPFLGFYSFNGLILNVCTFIACPGTTDENQPLWPTLAYLLSLSHKVIK